jgi:hypothetical protein
MSMIIASTEASRSPRIERPALSADQDFSKPSGLEDSSEWKLRLRLREFQRDQDINRDRNQIIVGISQMIAIRCGRTPPIYLQRRCHNGRERRSISCINPSE